MNPRPSRSPLTESAATRRRRVAANSVRGERDGLGFTVWGSGPGRRRSSRQSRSHAYSSGAVRGQGHRGHGRGTGRRLGIGNVFRRHSDGSSHAGSGHHKAALVRPRRPQSGRADLRLYAKRIAQRLPGCGGLDGVIGKPIVPADMITTLVEATQGSFIGGDWLRLAVASSRAFRMSVRCSAPRRRPRPRGLSALPFLWGGTAGTGICLAAFDVIDAGADARHEGANRHADWHLDNLGANPGDGRSDGASVSLPHLIACDRHWADAITSRGCPFSHPRRRHRPP